MKKKVKFLIGGLVIILVSLFINFVISSDSETKLFKNHI